MDGNRHIPISNKKAEELLACLAVKGVPISKEKAAELLWVDAEPQKARDSLNKVISYLKKIKKNVIPELPLYIRRNELYLDISNIYCDIWEFKQIYKNGTQISDWEKAVALYTGPLLFENYYEWSVMDESYFDIRYGELLEKLEAACRKEGRIDMANFYSRMLEDFR